MSWASVSLNVARLVYCSGRQTARTSAAAGAQRAPTSRPASPAKDRIASAPRMGAIAAAPSGPPAHTPMASSIGSPAMNCGTTDEPTWKKPRLLNVRP